VDPLDYETLQISPNAEPEVIAAAYRALAKKYHPDRSTAPDSMMRMSRLNAAYAALKTRAGRIASNDTPLEPPASPLRRLSPRGIDPGAPLEELLATVSSIVTSARQQLIDEMTEDGVPREVASSLVATALRELSGNSPDSRHKGPRPETTRIDPSASFDEALKVIVQRAQTMRDQLVDDLVRDGLNRGTAQELADTAIERTRRKARTAGAVEARLTPERVDLSGPLNAGIRIVAAKLQAARQIVLEELARDGIPHRTAVQLVQAASETDGPARRGK